MDKYKAVGIINFLFGIIEGIIPLIITFIVIISLLFSFLNPPHQIPSFDLRYIIPFILFTIIGIYNLKSAFKLTSNNLDLSVMDDAYGLGVTLIVVSTLALISGSFFLLVMVALSIH
ncbi:MAG: hypothetical protein PHQ59_01390 [Candidatus Daviesbacteria bacterium]|nr:hypothetical protein [Candidatus Daviesbacteria bacterium]